MNRTKILRLSIRLTTQLVSTRQPWLSYLNSTQVTRFSQLTKIPHLSSPVNPQKLFFSSNSQSFIDLISSNIWSEKIEIELEKIDLKLTHELIIYTLMKLNKNPQKSLDFFKWVCIKKGFNLSYVPYTILLKTLACRDFVKKFWVVALEMKEKGFYIDNQLYLHVNMNLKRQNLGNDATEWTKYHKMVCDFNVGKDVVMYVVNLILGCDWSEEVESKLKGKVKFPVSENFMVRVLRELWKKPVRALKFFEWVGSFGGYEHDSVTYNDMVKVLAQPESVDEFWELVGRMRREGFEVDLDSYIKISRLECLPIVDAVKLFEFMMDGPYKLSVSECTSLLKSISLESNPDMDLVYRVVNKYVGVGNTLTKVVYDGMHRVLCKIGRLDEAKKIVQEMRDAGYKPDNVTYSQEVFGLCTQKRFKDACNLLDEMVEDGCFPDIKTCTILLQGFCAAKEVDQALSCFCRMMEKNVNPDAEMLEVLINGLLSEDKLYNAYRFLVEMVKKGRMKPLQATYKLMIEKLSEIGQPKEAIYLLRMMKNQGYPPFPDPIVQYISKSGTIDDAIYVLQALSGKGDPSSAACVFVIKSFFEEGRESEARELMLSCPYRVRQQKTISNMFSKPLSDQSDFSLKGSSMVTGNIQEDRDNNPKGVTRSWGTAVSGQSVSTSGSVGSPSSRSEAGMATPARDNTVLRLSNLEILGDDSASQDAVPNKKKKRGQRATGTDKSGRGLRQFSMKVCEKVESKGRTTYNEVADELVAEYAEASNALGTNEQGYDEKNIRRRVYDALNVLMAMDIISKDKKEIQWRGLPRTSLNDVEELKTERVGLRNRIEKKAAYLQELEEQFVGYQNLIQRNQQLYGNGNTPTGGVALPFILVQTRPNATVEVEISEDMQLVHFDFNSTPFELHDDNYVLKQMNSCEKPRIDSEAFNPPGSTRDDFSIPNAYHPQTPRPPSPKPCHFQASQPSSPPKIHLPHVSSSPSPSPSNTYRPPFALPSSRSSTSINTPPSSSLPGILKARVQHEQ